MNNPVTLKGTATVWRTQTFARARRKIHRLMQIGSPVQHGALLLSLFVLLGLPLRAAAADTIRLDNVALQTADDRPWQPPSPDDAPIVVVAFLGTECPLARLYAPRLAQLAARFDASDVQFVAAFSNLQDDREKVLAYDEDFSLGFPLVLDPRHELADHLSAQRTPEVFVLDRQRTVRYRGRIDDQYGVDFQRPAPRVHDLARALDELVRGADVSQPRTEAVGCIIGRTTPADPEADVTWSSHIAEIVQRRCQTCHRPGEIGPFSLLDYDDAVGWAPTIAEVVSQGRMPPWHANPAHGTFANDARLTSEEQELIQRWVQQGAPEGDPSQVPAPREFADGWQFAEPDRVVYMSDTPFVVPATGVIDYQYFVADLDFTTDRWVRAAECRPGNRTVVHHVNVFVVPPEAQDDLSPEALSERWTVQSEMLCGYVPGMRPKTYLPGMARLVRAGSKLVFQLHYTPNGQEAADRSCVGLWFMDAAEVERPVRTVPAMNTWFEIPPHEDDYRVEVWHHFKRDTLVLSFLPHMHLRGKSFRYIAHLPDGETETLLDVPEYDFDWQNTYLLAEPLRLPAGSKLQCVATFDNSADNPDNPNPDLPVRWGEQSWEEMMIGYFDVSPVDASPPLASPSLATRRWAAMAGVLAALAVAWTWQRRRRARAAARPAREPVVGSQATSP